MKVSTNSTFVVPPGTYNTCLQVSTIPSILVFQYLLDIFVVGCEFAVEKLTITHTYCNCSVATNDLLFAADRVDFNSASLPGLADSIGACAQLRSCGVSGRCCAMWRVMDVLGRPNFDDVSGAAVRQRQMVTAWAALVAPATTTTSGD